MTDVLHLHTVFEDPILPPPDILPGRNLLLIGVSSKGKQSDIIHVRDPDEMEKFYGTGPLVQAFREAYNNNAYAIYVCRLNSDEELSLDSNQMYERLEEVYDYIIDFPVHIVVPVGVYLDDPVHNFAKQLLDMCITKKDVGGCIGLIGVNPADPDKLDDHVDTLMSNEFMKEDRSAVEDGFEVDNGGYLVVVAHDATFNKGQSDEYSGSAVHAVAGLISSLAPNISATNKSVRGISDLEYRYSEKRERTDTVKFTSSRMHLPRVPLASPQVSDGAATPTFYLEGLDYSIDYDTGEIQVEIGGNLSLGSTVSVKYIYDDRHSLSKRGFTVLRDSVQRGFVPYKAVTASHPQSAYHSLSTTRIVLEILELMQEIDTYTLGKLHTSSILNTYERFLKEILDSKVEEKSIVSYRADLEIDSDTMMLLVTIMLQPVGEISTVGTIVRLDI